jgi:hypothetical protein
VSAHRFQSNEYLRIQNAYSSLFHFLSFCMEY